MTRKDPTLLVIATPLTDTERLAALVVDEVGGLVFGNPYRYGQWQESEVVIYDLADDDVTIYFPTRSEAIDLVFMNSLAILETVHQLRGQDGAAELRRLLPRFHARKVARDAYRKDVVPIPPAVAHRLAPLPQLPPEEL